MTLQLASEGLMLLAMLLTLYFSVTRFVLRKHFHSLKQGDDPTSKAMSVDIEKYIFPHIHGVTSVDMRFLAITASLAVAAKALSIYTLVMS